MDAARQHPASSKSDLLEPQEHWEASMSELWLAARVSLCALGGGLLGMELAALWCRWWERRDD